MIKLFMQGFVLVLLLTVSSVANAEEPLTVSDIPELKAESQHVTASRRIASYFTRYHYGKVALDEAMSEQIFDRYFEQLDYNRSFLLASDVEEFREHRSNFHEQLVAGNLAPAFSMYQLSLKRRFERYEYALSLLDEPMDFSVEGERYYYDRTERDWAESQQELDEIWQQRVKNDALNLAMAGREDDEIIDNLKRRYSSALQRLTQSQHEDAFQAVMNAFARSVDAHTSYLSPRNAERFQQNMNLSLEGIGAVLQMEYDYTIIRSLVPGGPADKTGELGPDDRIIGVAQGDQEFVDVIGWRLDEVVELIKGPKGSVVRLQVLKGSEGSGAVPEVVEIVRDEVRLEDREAKIDYEQRNGQTIAVIEIPGFYNNLAEHVLKLLVNAEPFDGLVIDLRGNGGGALHESINLSSIFIDKGPVVQVRDSSGRVDVSEASRIDYKYDGPMMVLIDRFSASASEIFAAAMQDYGRALIVGEQTYGKGTVQQHRGLQRRFDFYSNPMGSVQYTIAKFYRISGDSTQHKGVVPDIKFPSPIEPEDFGESKLENALPWDQIDPVSYNAYGMIDAALVAQLREAHESRIQQDPEFAYIRQDIERFRERQDRDYISLVKSERDAENEANRERQLNRVNERLQRLGKEPVESVDDADEDVTDPDPYYEEALRIFKDYLKQAAQEAAA